MEQTIPVVDLERFRAGDRDDQRAFVAQLGRALTEFGFVAVENHHTGREAIDGAYAAVRALFALPADVKARYEDPASGRQRGYTSLGTEHAKYHNVPDLKEFWHVGPEVTPAESAVLRVPCNLWPTELPQLRSAALELWRREHEVARVLLRAIARFLDADEDAFLAMIEGGNTVLRMIHYPAPDEAVEPGAVWAAAHEDINLITLLCEATDPGLELLTRDGTWLPITPIRGQLIADTGDMMERLTNGLLPSTTHRVLAPQGARKSRYSMPFFVHPRPEHVLTPLPGMVTEARPRRWEDITAEAYLFERFREIGTFATDSDE